MIVIEGPDGGGKTTLANQLSKDLGWEIAPRVVAQDTTAMVDLKLWVEENLKKGFHETIYDRHRLISEPIYGALRRAEFPSPGFDDPQWLSNQLHTFWEVVQPIVIICLPPLEIARERAMRDTTNHIFAGDYERMYRMYYYFAAQNRFRTRFDVYDDHTEYELVLNLVRLWIRSWKQRVEIFIHE